MTNDCTKKWADQFAEGQRQNIMVQLRVYVVFVFSIGSILLLINLNIDILIELVFFVMRTVERVCE